MPAFDPKRTLGHADFPASARAQLGPSVRLTKASSHGKARDRTLTLVHNLYPVERGAFTSDGGVHADFASEYLGFVFRDLIVRQVLAYKVRDAGRFIRKIEEIAGHGRVNAITSAFIASAGRFPGPRRLAGGRGYLPAVALHLFKEALSLRVALNLLGEALLVTLIKRPNAIEQHRGDGQEVLGLGGVDPVTELAGIIVGHHLRLSLRGQFPRS